MTLNITTICDNAKCRYADCCDLFIVILNVIMLSVIMLNVIMLNVVMLNVIMLNVVPPLKIHRREVANVQTSECLMVLLNN